MGYTFQIEVGGRTKHYSAEAFLEVRGGSAVLCFPEGVTVVSRGEYAGWYEAWCIEEGVYPIDLSYEKRKPYPYTYSSMKVMTDDPSIATTAESMVIGTFTHGDLQSRFGGVRVGGDPARRRIGKRETIRVYVDPKRIVALLEEGTTV